MRHNFRQSSLHIELWLAKLDLPTHIFALFVTLLKIDLFRNLSHTYLMYIVTSLWQLIMLSFIN